MNYANEVSMKALTPKEYSVVLDDSIYLVAERLDDDGVWVLLTENGTIIGDNKPYDCIHKMIDTYRKTIFAHKFDVHVMYQDSRKNLVKRGLYLADAIQEEIKRTRERDKRCESAGKYPEVQIHKSKEK